MAGVRRPLEQRALPAARAKVARSRPSAARSAGGATRSALIARTPTSQSDSTAHEPTRQIWPAFATCFLDRFTVGKDVASAHKFHSHHGGLGGVIGWSGRLPMSPAPVLTAWRERPPLVAGETAPPVKNGGRPHATVLTLTASPTLANRRGRRRAPPNGPLRQVAALLEVDAPLKASGRAAAGRENSSGRVRERGEHPALSPVPLPVPPTTLIAPRSTGRPVPTCAAKARW